MHRVSYDDGDDQWHNLDPDSKDVFRWLSETSPPPLGGPANLAGEANTPLAEERDITSPTLEPSSGDDVGENARCAIHSALLAVATAPSADREKSLAEPHMSRLVIRQGGRQKQQAIKLGRYPLRRYSRFPPELWWREVCCVCVSIINSCEGEAEWASGCDRVPATRTSECGRNLAERVVLTVHRKLHLNTQLN